MGKTRRKGPPKGEKLKQPSGKGMTFKDRDLCKVNPLSEQFEPTDATPISNHKQMGGIS
jgi:hypothetical protein